MSTQYASEPSVSTLYVRSWAVMYGIFGVHEKRILRVSHSQAGV